MPEERPELRLREATDAELAELRHKWHLALGDRGKCTEECTHEPLPPCPVCGEPA